MKKLFFVLMAFVASVRVYAEDTTVVMDKFEVRSGKLTLADVLSFEDNEWFKFQPFTQTDPKTGKEVMISLMIMAVKPNSPAAKAGLKNGMGIKSIQEIPIYGLTTDELREKAMARPGKDNMRFMYLTGASAQPGSMVTTAKRINLPLTIDTPKPAQVVASRE